MDTQENRNESNNVIRFARAAAAFMVLVVLGYAISTQVESAVDNTAPAATLAASPAPDQASWYLPAQVVNKAREVEAPIPSF